MSANQESTTEITPSARRLTSSLRDIGYDTSSAVADLVDNSVSAGARRVDIEIVHHSVGSYLTIADDGRGMAAEGLDEAMRFGSQRNYGGRDLGKYGLGLKTASLSQCRRLTVITRTSQSRVVLRTRCLDLDHIERTDRWEVLNRLSDHDLAWAGAAADALSRGPGTVVIWDRLDRLMRNSLVNPGAAKRRLRSVASALHSHLGMVFHRFIEGQAEALGGESLTISINGEKVRPWNPFAEDQVKTVRMPVRRFEVEGPAGPAEVTFRPFVLPAKSLFDSLDAFERMSGPRRWNRQQGLYVYRADRLVQGGGWAGMRSIDEHTKLARAAIEFGPELDDLFRVNVAKMRAILPTEVRQMVEPEVGALCKRAQAMYRKDQRTGSSPTVDATETEHAPLTDGGVARLATGLISAALATGRTNDLMAIIDHLRDSDPDLTRALGW